MPGPRDNAPIMLGDTFGALAADRDAADRLDDRCRHLFRDYRFYREMPPVGPDAIVYAAAHFDAATFSRHPEISRDQRGAILRLHRNNALAMVKRRALKAGIDPKRVCNHTFRATGITTFLENGGEIENARRMAAHATIKTTQVYDRRGDAVKIADVERIRYEIKEGKP